MRDSFTRNNDTTTSNINFIGGIITQQQRRGCMVLHNKNNKPRVRYTIMFFNRSKKVDVS